jgi:hypothetical protein
MTSVISAIVFFSTVTANIWLWSFIFHVSNLHNYWYEAPLVFTAIICSLGSSILAALAYEWWALR